MSRRDDNDWVPVAAGLAIGVGVLALLYKLLSGGGCRGSVNKQNQQQGTLFACTCGKAAPCKLHVRNIMCDCAEEKARRLALERKRQLAGYASGSDQSSSSGGPGVPWYSILGGTALLALTALAVKTGADRDGWARPIYLFFGLETEKPPGPCPVKIDDAKRKWPLEETSSE